MPETVQHVDGNEQDRRGTVSVFDGPDPEFRTLADAERENQGVADWIKKTVADGIASAEIGVFVRSNGELARARATVKAAGHTQLEFSGRLEQPQGRIAIGTTHLANGLEYNAIAVMACDDDVLPLQERNESVADDPNSTRFTTPSGICFTSPAPVRATQLLHVSPFRPANCAGCRRIWVEKAGLLIFQ